MFLCFIEDEFYTREGILNSIDWQALQIDRLESTSDGKAGESLLTLRPDILLTDIRIPKRNVKYPPGTIHPFR